MCIGYLTLQHGSYALRLARCLSTTSIGGKCWHGNNPMGLDNIAASRNEKGGRGAMESLAWCPSTTSIKGKRELGNLKKTLKPLQGLDDIAASRKEKGGRGAMESLAPGVSRRGTLYVGSSIAVLRGKVQPASEAFDPDVYLGLVHGVRRARPETCPAHPHPY